MIDMKLLKWGVIALTVVGVLTSFMASQRKIGAESAYHKVEKQNEKVTSRAGSAGGKSRAGDGRLRDPYAEN